MNQLLLHINKSNNNKKLFIFSISMTGLYILMKLYKYMTSKKDSISKKIEEIYLLHKGNLKKIIKKEDLIQLYYTIYNTIFKEDKDKYEESKRRLYKNIHSNKELEVYINLVCVYISNQQKNEEIILKYLKHLLNKDNFQLDDINITTNDSYDKMRRDLYEKKDLSINQNLNLDKTKEILYFLFDKTKENIIILKKIHTNKPFFDEEIMIYLAQTMAFDEVYLKNGISEEDIKYAISYYGLTFKIDNNDK